MEEARVVSADPVYEVNRSNPLTQTTTGRLRVDVGSLADQSAAPNAVARLVSSAATTNPTSVKSSSGRLFRCTGYNANAAARYLKFYNKATAPTVGTDVPIWTEYLAPQSKFSLDFHGLLLSAGVAYALTTGAADNDTGALTSGDVMALNIGYL